MSTEQKPLDDAKVYQMATDYFDMPTDNTRMGDYYDQMSPQLYDAMMGSVGYTEPDEIVKNVFKLSLPTTARIMDVGAGTGLIGTKLITRNYCNIHALDAS